MLCKCGTMETVENGAIVDGVYYCSECKKLFLFKCEICGKWHANKDKITLLRSEICEECNKHNFFCYDCCEWHDRRDVEIYFTYDGSAVCENCIEEYYQCEECGEYFKPDDEEDYCPNCRGNYILDYHEDWSINYKHTAKEIGHNRTYFGIELEVSGEEKHAKKIYNIFEDDVVLMHDSSIIGGGFEIISQPMTRAYYEKFFTPRLEKALVYMRDNGFRSFNKGGMHVHFSIDYFDTKDLAQLAEILYGDNNDQNTWLQISQRTRSNLNEWASMRNAKSFYTICEEDSICRPTNGERYTALNYSYDTDTLEIRIFNGNMLIERIHKNMECVFALLDYVKTINSRRPVANTTKFLEFVLEHEIDYPNLYKFIVDRKIKEQHDNDEFTYENEVA